MSDKTPKLPSEEKVAVYICHCGGNISDSVNVEELERLARDIPGVSVVHRNSFMCSDPGQQMIIDELKAGNADRVVVCACAPHLHETTFRGAVARGGTNPYMYEHANIREQVSWVHHGPTATAKAAKLIEAAVAKARNLTPLEPIRMEARRHATVVGGGVAGMKAALDIARRGIDVLLVEKSPFLGGNVAKLDRLFPTEDKAADLLGTLYAAITANPRIKVVTCAEVASHSGYVGSFDLTVKRTPPASADDLDRVKRFQDAGAPLGTFVPFVGFAPVAPAAAEETIPVATGAIVLAVGFRHYTPKPGEYGYGDNPEVIRLTDLIEQMAGPQAEGGTLQVNGRPVKTMALIRCVGSRHIPGVDAEDENGKLNEHCSRVCCTASLQAEREIKARFPETVIYDFYRDIRAYGRGHEDYYCGASKDGVLFIRFEPTGKPVVARAPEGSENPLTVTVADKLLAGRELEVPVDLVVLANGVAPQDTAKIVELMKIPVGADRFLLEVHPKLRPVEVAEAGILLAGTCQVPMDTTEASCAAAAAAVKAAAVLSRGYVELDPYVARVNADTCRGTGACVEECPQDCIALVDGKARINPALCTGCGMCVAVCPSLAIEVNGWTLNQYEAMVDAIVGA